MEFRTRDYGPQGLSANSRYAPSNCVDGPNMLIIKNHQNHDNCVLGKFGVKFTKILNISKVLEGISEMHHWGNFGLGENYDAFLRLIIIHLEWKLHCFLMNSSKSSGKKIRV